MYYYGSLALSTKYRRCHHPAPKLLGEFGKERERCRERCRNRLVCERVGISQTIAIYPHLHFKSERLIKQEKLCFVLLFCKCKICTNCRTVGIISHHLFLSSPYGIFQSWNRNGIYLLCAVQMITETDKQW